MPHPKRSGSLKKQIETLYQDFISLQSGKKHGSLGISAPEQGETG
jgi:hypothetical protein